MAEDIGSGFWAGLTLKPDTASFAAGERALNSIAGGLKAIAGVLVTQKIASEMMKLAEAQAKLNVTASFAGLDTDALTEWMIMMKTANVDSQAFIGSLTDLNNQFIRLQTQGEALPEKTAKAVGLLGLDLSKIMGEDSARRSADIMTAAAQKVSSGTMNTAASAQLVANLLGNAGAEYFTWLEKSGKSLEEQLTLANNLMFTSANQRSGVMGPVADLNALRATFGEMASQFSSEFMIRMDPAFKDLLTYITTHKKEISDTIKEWADRFGDLAGSLGKLMPAVGATLDTFGSLLDFFSGKKTADQSSLAMMYAAQKAGVSYTLQDVTQATGGFHPLRNDWQTIKDLFVGNKSPRIRIELSPDAKRYLIVNTDTGDLIQDAGAVSTQK